MTVVCTPFPTLLGLPTRLDKLHVDSVSGNHDEVVARTHTDTQTQTYRHRHRHTDTHTHRHTDIL